MITTPAGFSKFLQSEKESATRIVKVAGIKQQLFINLLHH
jgi:hypothetical protein